MRSLDIGSYSLKDLQPVTVQVLRAHVSRIASSPVASQTEW